MKQVIFRQYSDSLTIDSDRCDVRRLIVIHTNRVGAIVCIMDEGLPNFKIVWTDGGETDFYKSLQALMAAIHMPVFEPKIYQV
jgi:hypothetical protein